VIFPALFQRLEISGLSRIGLRIVYSKQFDKRQEAADFVIANTPIPKLNGKHMNVDGRVLDPEFALNYESDVLGFSVRVKAQESTMTLNVPPEFKDLLPETKTVRSFATLDVDYYAHGATPITSFNAAAIIDSWLHLIRRDIVASLGW
jgi:hypothetical protein